jgi:hypothetical protein
MNAESSNLQYFDFQPDTEDDFFYRFFGRGKPEKKVRQSSCRWGASSRGILMKDLP